MTHKIETLRLILGDQLTHSISSLQDIDKEHDLILMCEVREEATYVKHHKKKIAFLFSAMRHFANELRQKGYHVSYTQYDAPNNAGSFSKEVERAITHYKPKQIVVTFPGEYRVLKMLEGWEKQFKLPVEIREDDRFLSSAELFAKWAEGRKELRMEYFYRQMRKKLNILMNGDKPIGGKWNYDSQNRKPPPSNLSVPKPYQTKHDEITKEVLRLVEREFADHFGDLEPFHFAVTRQCALNALKSFIKDRLPYFGDYQDAMVKGEPWMYHSHLSFYLNCGLLTPMECIEAAEAAYHNKSAPLNAVEGFIRQILGWREYIRGIYWYHMPNYAYANSLKATRKLPDFFWDGETDMNCLSQCIKETKANAYAHHIQRLMVIGNFALLAGISPDEVNEWYLIVYADAYEWVEMPNVTGMILYADGGVVASKPYAAGGSYINKMSNYCDSCKYSVKEKTGDKACPFNYLYWDFLIRNKSRLKNNQRLGVVYHTLEKMDDTKRQQIRKDARQFLDTLP